MISEHKILNARILIVDDKLSNVQLLEQLLLEFGYVAVTSTTDPTEVGALYRQNRYDLILLDLLMPTMDGFQVMESLKEIESNAYLPILVITAQPNHKLLALQAGAKDFIAKPFDLIEVKTRIYNMLEVRLLYLELERYNQELEQKVLQRTAELHASEARFRRLTELSSDWYWEQDEQGNFVNTYGPAFEMLGLRQDEALNTVWDNQDSAWNQAEREKLLENLVARRPFLDYVYSRIVPDGSRQYLMISGEPKFDASGRFIGYYGIGKDVTASIHATSKLPAA